MGWILLLFHFAAGWNTVPGHMSTAQLSFHRGGVYIVGKGSKSSNHEDPLQ